MKEGFGNTNKVKAVINDNELDKVLKQYKKLNKYRKSSIYTLKMMDGDEKIISSLLKEYGE